MERRYLLKTIKTALRMASGKSMDEAAAIVADAIEMVSGVMEDTAPPAPVVSEPISIRAEAPPPLSVVAEPLPPPTQPAKQVNDPTKLNQLVNSMMPPMLEVAVNGNSLKLTRSVIPMPMPTGNEGGSPDFGIQVSYKAEGQNNPELPFPKVSFWTTDENLDFGAAVASIQDQASKIYGFKVKPIRAVRPAPPASVMAEANNLGDV